MLLEFLVLISIICSIAAPIIIFLMQKTFLERMKHELSTGIEQARNELTEMIEDPQTYRMIGDGITAEIGRRMDEKISRMREFTLIAIEEGLNQAIPVISEKFRYSMMGLIGNATKAMDKEAGDKMGDGLIKIVFGKAQSRAQGAKQLFQGLREKARANKLKKEGELIGSVEDS